MAIGKHLSDNNPDGTALGQSASDKISFFGATPVIRPTGPAAQTTGGVAAVSVTSTAIVTTGVVAGFQTQAQVTTALTAINSLITAVDTMGTAVNQIRAVLGTANLGLATLG